MTINEALFFIIGALFALTLLIVDSLIQDYLEYRKKIKEIKAKMDDLTKTIRRDIK
jgi:hypothetical protein